MSRRRKMTGLAPRETRIWDHKLGDYVRVAVTLHVDLDDIAHQLGKKAYANKSGKTRAMRGAITGRVDL